jgi:glycerol-3-phosphate acyltransferase PlsY
MFAFNQILLYNIEYGVEYMVTTIRIGILIAAYLIGSIPFGFIIGKLKGVDIREQGSKNIGATNVGRVLGYRYAVYTYLCDFAKGAFIVALFTLKILPNDYALFNPLFYGVITCVGHSYSVYLDFNGGKSVASASGVIFAYSWWIFLIAIGIFALIVLISKMVSLGSIVAASCIFLLSIFLTIFTDNPHYDIYFPVSMCLMVAIIFIRHKSNIKKIIANEENKVKWLEKK